MVETGRAYRMRGGDSMAAKVGDRIIVESQKVGRPARQGEILEVIEASYGTSYRVHWDAGHESTIRPAAGVTRTIRPRRHRSA
jgi:uncharacterized protein DUF1918